MDRAVLSGTAAAAQDTASRSSETPRNGRRRVLDMMVGRWFLVWDGSTSRKPWIIGETEAAIYGPYIYI
jgi:hypothetical protein